MPSESHKDLLHNLVDVERLIESHNALNQPGRGRRGLGHITRSGVVMLCAAWELYLEKLLVEGVKFLADRLGHPSDLPKCVQQALSKNVKEAKHELRPLDLAGEGWMKVYIDFGLHAADGMNSPKSTVVDGLFERCLGVENLSDQWSCGAEHVNKFVAIRGDIAHRGRTANYVTISSLKTHLKEIRLTCSETDNHVCSFLKSLNPNSRQPWKKIKIG